MVLKTNLDSIYLKNNLTQSLAQGGQHNQSKHHCSHLQWLAQGHTSFKWQFLDSSCHSIFSKAIWPHRITGSHVGLCKCPYLVTLSWEGPFPLSPLLMGLHCCLSREPGTPGRASGRDHSPDKEVWKAGSQVEFIWASSVPYFRLNLSEPVTFKWNLLMIQRLNP